MAAIFERPPGDILIYLKDFEKAKGKGSAVGM